MRLYSFRRIIAAEVKDMVACPAQFITLDAPVRVWVDRALVFDKALRMWRNTNHVVYGKRWRENKQGLLTIFVPELDRKKDLWHIHMIQEKHPFLTYDMYKALWFDLWDKEKERRAWERRGVDIRDLHRREWPQKPVDVIPYNPSYPSYHARYITKQASWNNMPFDSLGIFRNHPRPLTKLVSHDNLNKVLMREADKLTNKLEKTSLAACAGLSEDYKGGLT